MDSPDARRQCVPALATGGRNGGCDVSNLAAYDSTAEHRPWRWISVTRSGVVLGPAEAPDTEDDLAYATPRSGSFEPDREGRWRVIEDDIPRWSMLDGLSETFDPFITASGLRGAISGIVWTHTPGPSGSAFMYSTAARRRRSHYWSGEMPLPYRSIPFLPRFTLLGPIVRRGDWHGTIAFVVRTPAFRQHAAGPMMIQGRFGRARRTSRSSITLAPGSRRPSRATSCRRTVSATSRWMRTERS